MCIPQIREQSPFLSGLQKVILAWGCKYFSTLAINFCTHENLEQNLILLINSLKSALKFVDNSFAFGFRHHNILFAWMWKTWGCIQIYLHHQLDIFRQILTEFIWKMPITPNIWLSLIILSSLLNIFCMQAKYLSTWLIF